MSAVPKNEQIYRKLREREHPHCFVCGRAVESGLKLEFRCGRDGEVQAEFACRPLLEGYPCLLHGGVICAILDGAMTNCVFATGSVAVTGDLNVRFHKPVAAQGKATVHAWIEGSAPPLFKVAARLLQDGEIKATARARFVERESGRRFLGNWEPR